MSTSFLAPEFQLEFPDCTSYSILVWSTRHSQGHHPYQLVAQVAAWNVVLSKIRQAIGANWLKVWMSGADGMVNNRVRRGGSGGKERRNRNSRREPRGGGSGRVGKLAQSAKGNGHFPGKGCFQPRAFSRQKLFPGMYRFQPRADHSA